MPSQYEDEILERDLREVADHGVRIWCNWHRTSGLDSCEQCDDETPPEEEYQNDHKAT